MKKVYMTLLLVSFGLNSYSQYEKNQKIEQVGDLFEVTIFYDNGTVMQHGFLNQEKKLHALWETYYPNGNKKSIAFYNDGIKVGTWYYWFMDKKTKVVYNNNKIIKVEEVDLQ